MKRYSLLWVTAIIVAALLTPPVSSAETAAETQEQPDIRRILVSITKTKSYTFDSYLAAKGKRKYNLIMITVDRKTGKKIHDAEVSFKLTTPAGKEGPAIEALTVGAYKYGAYFNMPEKGKYIITCTADIKGKKEQAQLEYEVN
jgi:hypothetical protein